MATHLKEFSRCHNSSTFSSNSQGEGHPNVTSEPNSDLWELIERQEREELLLKTPTFVMLGALMVMGVPGNLLVLVVYGLRFGSSTTRVFVMSMAAFDLLNCLVGIPFEMEDLYDDISLGSGGVCKTFRFLTAISTFGSGSVLVAVSADRFRRVCRPLRRQMSVQQSVRVVVVCSVAALLISIPALVFYGVATEYRYGYRLYDCSIDDAWGMSSPFVFLYQMMLGALWIICIIILVCVYTFIIYRIQTQKQIRRKMSTSPVTNPTRNPVIGVERSVSYSGDSQSKPPGAAVDEYPLSSCFIESKPSTEGPDGKSRHTRAWGTSESDSRVKVVNRNTLNQPETRNNVSDKKGLRSIDPGRGTCLGKSKEAHVTHAAETSKQLTRMFSRDVNPVISGVSTPKEKLSIPGLIVEEKDELLNGAPDNSPPDTTLEKEVECLGDNVITPTSAGAPDNTPDTLEEKETLSLGYTASKSTDALDIISNTHVEKDKENALTPTSAVDFLTPTSGISIGKLNFLSRQTSLNNYYAASQASDGSLDNLSYFRRKHMSGDTIGSTSLGTSLRSFETLEMSQEMLQGSPERIQQYSPEAIQNGVPELLQKASPEVTQKAASGDSEQKIEHILDDPCPSESKDQLEICISSDNELCNRSDIQGGPDFELTLAIAELHGGTDNAQDCNITSLSCVSKQGQRGSNSSSQFSKDFDDSVSNDFSRSNNKWSDLIIGNMIADNLEISSHGNTHTDTLFYLDKSDESNDEIRENSNQRSVNVIKARDGRKTNITCCMGSLRVWYSDDNIIYIKSDKSIIKEGHNFKTVKQQKVGNIRFPTIQRSVSIPGRLLPDEFCTGDQLCRHRKYSQKINERWKQNTPSRLTREERSENTIDEVSSSVSTVQLESNRSSNSTTFNTRKRRSTQASVTWDPNSFVNGKQAECILAADGEKSTDGAPNCTDRAESTQKKISRKLSRMKSITSRFSRQKSTNSHSREIRTAKVTYTMLAVTVGFILSYLPHLGIQLYRGLDLAGVHRMLCSSSVYFAIHHLCLRSIYINHAINPIIYSFYNETFQRKARKLLQEIVSRLCKMFGCGRFRNWSVLDSVQSSSQLEDDTG